MKILLLSIITFWGFWPTLVFGQPDTTSNLLDNFKLQDSLDVFRSSPSLPDSVVLKSWDIDKELQAQKQEEAQRKAYRRLSLELQLIDSLVKEDNYQQLNRLSNANRFQKVSFIGDRVRRKSRMLITARNLSSSTIEDLLKRFKWINRKLRVNITFSIAAPIEVDPLILYEDNKEGYCDYLMSIIKNMLGQHQEILDCSFVEYEAYEESKEIDVLQELINFRYQFILFCDAKLP
ncbi:hypothetical protein QWY93_15405 [Echinicola jeungdonensis]|uniref:Uncharacterized protein n=1 Tax=Echinicola jeungdonensis TaxID=709343 RepID=A0ABV5J4N3_9BACT|nr:hypothetical protein [Echinicola jeungdonensis]MDN3670710.1 hypothetical protein [Echinicola jeungdonensis]